MSDQKSNVIQFPVRDPDEKMPYFSDDRLEEASFDACWYTLNVLKDLRDAVRELRGTYALVSALNGELETVKELNQGLFLLRDSMKENMELRKQINEVQEKSIEHLRLTKKIQERTIEHLMKQKLEKK